MTRAAAIVEMDDFFKPIDQQIGASAGVPIGEAFDWSRLEREVLKPLASGSPAGHLRYDWERDRLGTRAVAIPRRSSLLVEGVSCTRQELSSYYTYRIWIEAPREVRLARGIERDGEAARPKCEDEWMPAEHLYEDQDPARTRAHLVVDGGAGTTEPNTFVVREQTTVQDQYSARRACRLESDARADAATNSTAVVSAVVDLMVELGRVQLAF